MKITVDRNMNLEGDLVFTITITDKHKAPFGSVEYTIMQILDEAKLNVEHTDSGVNKLKDDVITFIHGAKEKAFIRVIDNLKFSIKNSLETYFKAMCQEIYNWIYDAQDKPLKNWMLEFDPQRTTYYFDNDLKKEVNWKDPNYINDDKVDDEDDEEEDD